MQQIVAIGVVVLLALVGLLPGFRRLRAALGIEHFLVAGQLYLVIGIALGPTGVELLEPALLESFAPAVTFLLGWVGLIVGLRMEVVLLRRIAGRILVLTGVEAVVPAVLVPVALGVVPSAADHPGALIVAGACAAGTAATAARYLLRGKVNPEASFVQVAASLDDWALLGLALIAFSIASGGGATALSMGGASVGAALLAGVVVVLLAPRTNEPGEELVIIIGVASLAGGTAAYLGASSVVAGALAGAVVANGLRGRTSREVYTLVTRVERPFFHALVVVVGAMLDFDEVTLWVPMLLVILAARGIAKLAAGYGAARLSAAELDPSRTAAAMLPMSPLALAVAADFHLMKGGAFSGALLVAVAGAWVTFEGIAAVAAPRFLGARAEAGPDGEGGAS